MNINGEIVKILRAHKIRMQDGKPGTYQTDQKSFWHIQTRDGGIAVDELQWEGKKRMRIDDFLRGNQIPNG